MYKAKINIGDFKKGDEVPAEIAEIWNQMYLESPVEKIKTIEDDKKVIQETKNAKDKEDESNGILEDYLARNENVVKKNIKEDRLSETQLEKLLSIEKSSKKRSKVISTIEKRLKALE